MRRTLVDYTLKLALIRNRNEYIKQKSDFE